MARWVRQSEISSITRHSRRRTAYLLPHLSQIVVQAVQRYFGGFPNGEEVTLAVLAHVGESRLRSVDSHRSFDRLKQDLGLLAAQTVVDIYGPTMVFTLREDHNMRSSTRRNTWKQMPWVNRYTPHQLVQPSAKPKARIILDASAVRDFVEEGESGFPLRRILELNRGHPVSIGNTAYAELVISALKPSGGMDFEKWRSRVQDLALLIDPILPIVPGGYELASMIGAIPGVKFDFDATREYYKAIWLLFSSAKSIQELVLPTRFVLPSGAMFQVQLDVQKAVAERDAQKAEWAEKMTLFSAAVRELDDGRPASPEVLSRIVQSSLAWGGMPVSIVSKLGLVAEALALRIWEGACNKRPYNPRNKANDVFDFDLLYCVALPGWVCSTDKKLVNLVHAMRSQDRMDVMFPGELVERLRLETS